MTQQDWQAASGENQTFKDELARLVKKHSELGLDDANIIMELEVMSSAIVNEITPKI